MTDGRLVLIDELERSDVPGVVRLWEDAGLTRPWNDPVQDAVRALTGSCSTILGARAGINGEVLGSVMVGHDGHRGWVYYLAVATTHQGQGIGRDLMTAAEDWLRERGAVKLQLMVRAENDGVARFYEHLGYETAAVTTLGRWLERTAEDWVRAFDRAFHLASDEVLSHAGLVEAYDLGEGFVGVVTQNGEHLRARRYSLSTLEEMTRGVDTATTAAFGLLIGEIIEPSDLLSRRSALTGEDRYPDAIWSGAFPTRDD